MSTPRAWKQEAADLRKAVEKERGAAEAAEAEAASLREALDGERRAVRALRRDLQRQLKVAREAEATKTNDLLQQLRNKLTLELTEAVKNEREAVIKSTTVELQRLYHAQETELRKEFSRKEEDLRRQLRDALAHSRHPDASADPLQTSAKQGMAAPCPVPAADILALRALNKRLETRVQELEEAERRSADTVRSQYEEHTMREAEQQKMARRETHLLLEKLKSRDRSIENLQKEITTLKARLDETRNVRDRFDSEKPGESPRLGIKRPNTRNSGLPPEVMRARSSRMKDNNSNELNDEQQSCKNSKPLIPKTEVDGPKDDKKDFKSNITDDELIRHTTDIDKKEDKEIQTDTDEKPCIYKECSTNTDEEGLDSWTRAVGLETLYQVVVREHQDLQRAHQALLAKLKAEQRARLDLEAPIKIREENPINLALAAQIEELTAKQEELISENHDLREQNDLLEFRLLEMDSAPASLHFKTAPASPSRSPESRGGDREVDDVSDSGVLSLPTSEDISEADFHDLAMEPSSRDIKFKLAQLCLSIENVTDKVSIQQGLSLLRHYEVRLETALNTLSQDSLSVRSLTSPDSVLSSETSKSQSRIIATVLPFTDLSQSCGKQKDDVPLKKLFKDADCLQESGIFEESPEFCSRFTQTDCSSAKLETPGDLSLEIRKLKQIQERIEEQGSNKRLLRTNVNEANGLSTESKELAFYRDRVEMLENKLAIYESSGDEQIKKMNLRLDREILLSAEIKHLKERCRMLEELNRKLEEEKCEFEEAENDTRLRCQKLEVKLSALGEKKSDLQVQLQQNARTMSNLRSCLAEEERKRIEARQHASRMENLVQHYEQRNFELEEKEIESRCRAQMLEKTIPALQVYNTWKVANAICKSADEHRNSHNNNRSGKMIMSPTEVRCDGGNDGAKSNQNRKSRSIRSSLVPSYEREIGDQCNTNFQESTINGSDCIDQEDDYEDYLHDRIKQLELAIKCKEELQQQSLSPDQKNSLISKIQDLKKTNCDLECRLKDLEMKEGYYKQTLQQADEMWANMEGGYKEQLRELENKLDDKQNEIYEFEAMVRKLSCEKEMRQQLQERTCSLESEMKDYRFKIAEKECERKLLEKERLRLSEELEHTNEEFNYLKHVIEPTLRQQLEEHKKMTKELKREIESLEKDREQEIEDRLAEKLYKRYQSDSSLTESDEPFITPPETPERKKRSNSHDSHKRNIHKDHKNQSKTSRSKSSHSKSSHSKSSSITQDSTQILICDDCLLSKRFLLACISCGREFVGGEGFSSYHTSTSSSDMEQSRKSSLHVPGVNKSRTESGVANEKNENASLKNGSDAVGPDHKSGDDRVERTDRIDEENRDSLGKDMDDRRKSHENEETNSSNDKDTGSDRKDGDEDQTKDESEKSDRKDDKDTDSKDKDGDSKDDNNDDDNDDNSNGGSRSKDPNNSNSNSKDKDDDDGKDGNSTGNSFQANNGEEGNENDGRKDGNSDNKSESNSNQGGNSVDGSDKKGDSSVDGAVKENSVSRGEQENSVEAEGPSKRTEMDLETFYVFMNPATVSNHFFKTPVPDLIPIYKSRYYDSTLVRTSDLFDGGASSWYPPFLPYPTFKDQLLKSIIGVCE